MILYYTIKNFNPRNQNARAMRKVFQNFTIHHKKLETLLRMS
jgi:hypothetical protein